MLQFDGSHHAWFGPQQPRCCLMNLVDDARGVSMGYLAPQETTKAALQILWMWVARYGAPGSLYLDRKSTYLARREPTREEQLAGVEPLTEFGHACKKLGIELITAYSPQAKGRVERKHAVYQDRLVHEIRLRALTTLEQVNRLLRESFDDELNQKFAVEARCPKDAHRPVPRRVDLRDVFCSDHLRVVANDYTVQFGRKYHQISALNAPLPKRGEKVLVRIWMDGTMRLLYKTKPLIFHVLPKPPVKSKPIAAAKPSNKRKPAPGHPWKRRAKQKETTCSS